MIWSCSDLRTDCWTDTSHAFAPRTDGHVRNASHQHSSLLPNTCTRAHTAQERELRFGVAASDNSKVSQTSLNALQPFVDIVLMADRTILEHMCAVTADAEASEIARCLIVVSVCGVVAALS